MTDSNQKRGSVTTELAVAVELVDVYTGGPVSGDAHVSLVGDGNVFRQGPSRYYVLQDIPTVPDPVTVAVRCPGYLDETVSKDHIELDDTAPLVTVELTPGPAYGFESGETLVRGLVVDGEDNAIAGATVSFEAREVETETTDQGEFVLWISDLEPEELEVTDDGRRFVRPADPGPVVRAEHPDGTTTTAPVELEVGTTASVTLSF